MKTKLFSSDGIDCSHARREPDSVYFPDENTHDEIKFLFMTLRSTQNGQGISEGVVDIRNLPYSADFGALASDAQGNLLSVDDIVNGMCRVATHFISSHQLIQSRVNAYIRCKLAAAEAVLNVSVRSQSEQSVERDQILLSSATVPSSPREPSGFLPDVNTGSVGRISRGSSLRRIPSGRGDGTRDTATPPPGTLFRSTSVLHDHLRNFATNVVRLDDATLRAVQGFLSEAFLPAGVLRRKSVAGGKADSNSSSPWSKEELAEVWEFFDLDDDGIVSRDDLAVGLHNIAKCYLAMDDFTQLMANSYVQRKVRRAINAIGYFEKNKALSPALSEFDVDTTGKISTEDAARETYPPNSTIIYIDEEGNNHVAKILRVSQRKMAGKDAYYIETKGVKLYVSVNRLRPLQAQDRAMLERQDPHSLRQQQQQQYQIYHSQSQQQQPALQLQHPMPLLSTSSSSRKDLVPIHPYTPKSPSGHSGAEDGVPPRTHSSRAQPSPSVQPGDTPSKGGILGYLKSSLGLGTKSAVVVPTASDSTLAVTRDPSLLGDQADCESIMDSIDDRVIQTDAVIVVNSKNGQLSGLSAGHGSSSDTLDRLAAGELPPMDVTVAVEAEAEAVLEGTANSLTSQDNSAATASQRLKMATALLVMDGMVLQLVCRATGPAYKLARTMVPKPKKIEPYPIYFNRGKNGFFEFNQVDFGVQFVPFMKDILPPADPHWQSHNESLSETNRCFFLHFGVAMGLHPFSLQQCFRGAAAELLKFPDNEMTIFFGEALESLLLRNDFVDAQVLSAIWPLEFDKYKVLVVRVDHNGRIESFTSFRSEAGPVDEHGEWNGEELIFTLQWNHFTILKPKSDQLNRPITAVLAAASMIGIMPLEFITKVDPDPSKRFKIC